MTPQPQQKQDYLTECHCFSEEEYPYCNDRAMPCRYKDQFSQRRCPDYKSVIHHQVECDVRNGTMFAQQMVSYALGEPIYSRPAPSPKTRMKAYDKFVRDTLKPHVDAIKAEAAAQACSDIIKTFAEVERLHDVDGITYPDLYNEFIERLKKLRSTGGEPR